MLSQNFLLTPQSLELIINPVKFTIFLMGNPFNSDQIKEMCTNEQSQSNVAELIVPNQDLLDKLLIQKIMSTASV